MNHRSFILTHHHPFQCLRLENAEHVDRQSRYYISSIEKGDYPARANHIGDILGDTETAYNAEGEIDRPYLIGVANPISFICRAYNAHNDQR